MFGYIYKITNSINGKIYIGLHKSKDFDESYWGSGSNLKEDYKKFGKANFTREILEQCDTLKQLNEREQYWIEYLDSRNPLIGYNIQPGGVRFFGYEHPQETKIRLSEKAKQRGSYGKWINNGHIERYLKSDNELPDGFTYGRLPSTVTKMADKHRGKKLNRPIKPKSSRGSHWYTNGIKDTMAFSCPEGFVPGRTNIDVSGSKNPMFGKPSPTKGTHMSEASKQILRESLKNYYSHPKKWINNGVIETKINDIEDLPNGFSYGRLIR